MKATIKIEKEVDIKTIKVIAGVRYWEDGLVNGTEDTIPSRIPCKEFDNWCPVIDIDSGIILNWTKGKTAEVHYKVCDQCCWKIYDVNGIEISSVEDEYVPGTLCPEGDGYGDYIIMNIDSEGRIRNWKFNLADFFKED